MVAYVQNSITFGQNKIKKYENHVFNNLKYK